MFIRCTVVCNPAYSFAAGRGKRRKGIWEFSLCVCLKRLSHEIEMIVKKLSVAARSYILD
jgi:hypothetical protein